MYFSWYTSNITSLGVGISYNTLEVRRTLKRLELHSAAPRATLTPLSCSPNFPCAQYLDIRMLTHELIVKWIMSLFGACWRSSVSSGNSATAVCLQCRHSNHECYCFIFTFSELANHSCELMQRPRPFSWLFSTLFSKWCHDFKQRQRHFPKIFRFFINHGCSASLY